MICANKTDKPMESWAVSRNEFDNFRCKFARKKINTSGLTEVQSAGFLKVR